MHIYLVGGAVRDELLGLPVKDRDYVVVGATPQDMLDAGFRPVGKDFPVFLHPRTQEEYALARTERKTAPGYTGFAFHAAPDVTLEQDLQRRDLTINAMARAENGVLIDPYHGQEDLAQRTLRHVSEAFSEDPVRILRLARFAARFSGFEAAPETLHLMQTMVASGEVDALVGERIWQELSRGLMADQPSRMFSMLQQSCALSRIWPAFDADWTKKSGPVLARLDQAAQDGTALTVRFAVLAGAFYLSEKADDAGIEENTSAVRILCERWRVPAELRDLAVLVVRHGPAAYAATSMPPESLIDWMTQSDVWRKPARFDDMLLTLTLLQDTSGTSSPLPVAFLTAIKDAARAVDAGAVAREASQQTHHDGTAVSTRIAAAVRAARSAAVEAVAGQKKAQNKEQQLAVRAP